MNQNVALRRLAHQIGFQKLRDNSGGGASNRPGVHLGENSVEFRVGKAPAAPGPRHSSLQPEAPTDLRGPDRRRVCIAALQAALWGCAPPPGRWPGLKQVGPSGRALLAHSTILTVEQLKALATPEQVISAVFSALSGSPFRRSVPG